MKKVILIITILLLTGCTQPKSNIVLEKPININKPVIEETQKESEVIYPIEDFNNRITKKPFGIYITPNTSPVQPEKFTGYHTGVDVEYDDVKAEVPVFSIADGEVLYFGRVGGYGGVIVIQHQINDQQYVAIYGHLDQQSIIDVLDVKKGERIAILGKGYTAQTDGERKHLHFALYKGSTINFKGYVQAEEELSGWVDPELILK